MMLREGILMADWRNAKVSNASWTTFKVAAPTAEYTVTVEPADLTLMGSYVIVNGDPVKVSAKKTTPSEQYRAKANEMLAMAKREKAPTARIEYENLASAYLRL